MALVGSSVVLVFLIILGLGKIMSQKCVMFNFGDSNSDTGANVVVSGAVIGGFYGKKFNFHMPATRYSDGRLYIDFLCESLEMPYLSPYLQSLGSNFSHGANFAYFGATAAGKDPFSLPTQINEFSFFKNLTQLLRSQGNGPMITDEEFASAIYAIDIGQNDLNLYFNGSSYSDIVSKFIPEIFKSLENAVKTLYDLGGSKYYLYNTGPLGCLPSVVYRNDTYAKELDEARCKVIYNDASKAFNEGFSILCDKLKSQLKEAIVVCVDMYSIKYDLFVHLHEYGFGDVFDLVIDYTHYSEAGNAIVAPKILSGAYSQPQIKLGDLCTR